MMSITGKQIAMARILLDLNQKDLADRLGIARKTIMRIENGQSPGSTKTLETIQTFFENHGIAFLEDDGVKRQKDQVKKLTGKQGMHELMSDIYMHAKTTGGQISLFNARPVNWLNWIDEEWFYETYSKGLAALSDKIKMKIIAVEGETELISKGHAENRFMPNEYFVNENRSFYVYSNKIAFINFGHNALEILILENQDFAAGVEILFNIAWDRVAIKPPPK